MKNCTSCVKTIVTVMAVFLLLLGAAPSGASDTGKITMKGSTTVLPVAQVMAEEFMTANPDVTMSVQGGGSGVGIAALLDGTTDIANASRGIKSAEVEKARSRGINPVEHVIAMDGIAVAVHPSNPVRGLTRDQLRAIYTGDISDWSELGGPRSRIVAVSRDSSSGTFETFEELALDGDRVRPDALTTASNQAVAQTVSQTPGAIGYIGLGYLSNRVKALVVDGVPCTRENVLNGRYVLSRPLFMYTNGKPAGSVKKFLDYALSPAGQTLVEEEGFVGNGVGPR